MSYIELEFLSDSDRTKKICSMYWDLDEDGDFVNSVSSVATVFDITSYDVQQKIKKSCLAYATTIKCSTCGTRYVYKNRSDFQRKTRDSYIKCRVCIEDDEIEKERKTESILSSNYELAKKSPFSVDNLSFKEAIYLLSLVRYQASENFKYLKPYLSNQTELLSPRHEYDIDIYRKLISENIIIISPKTDLEALTIDEDETFSYRIDKAFWELPYNESIHPSMSHLIAELEKKLSSMDWEESWYEEARELCKDISLQESLAYLDYVMSEHQFVFVAGEKTFFVLNKILENHSVAQLYSLIWGCAKDAAAYYMRSNIPKVQAANSVIGGIERKYERYVTNGWEINPFKRNYKLPISVISQVLFNTTLQTDDGGFNIPLKKII